MLVALAAPASAQNPGAAGAWSAVQNYPVVPVSAGVMPDGKIVAWDQANAAPWFGPVPHNGPAMVLDPGSGVVTRSSNQAPNTLFCSLLTSLPDGRLAVIGGGSDQGSGASSKVQIYDEDSRTFSVIGQMERTRWYPGGSIDSQGNPIVAGGTSTGIERIDAATGTGTLLNTSFPAHWYADLIRTPDNRFAIEDVGDLQGGENSSRFMLNGTSLSSASDTTLLRNRYRGIRTMIGPHKMLWSSGGTSRESMIIDASGSSPTYSAAASSAFPHMTGQGVTLPTGDVLAVGGNSTGQGSIGTPVMTPELYKPDSNSWSSMANMSRQRQYHSVAALLPDGRVWSAGTSWEGTQEANGQYFSPPYLFTGSGQPASRPTATDAPSSVEAGDSFSVATTNPSQIRSASMIRLAATTHQLNAGQAYVPLSTSVSPNGGRVQMTAPSGAQAPPGYYMVFLIDSNGVPSVAPIVRLRSGASTALPVRATQSSQLDRNWPASEAFDGNSGSAGGPSGSVSQTQSQSEPWWEVDLGEKRNIGSVTIQLRTDAGTNRDVWVYASDNPITSTTISGARALVGGDVGQDADTERLAQHRAAEPQCPLPARPGSGDDRPQPRRGGAELHPRYTVPDGDRCLADADQSELGRRGGRDRVPARAKHVLELHLAHRGGPSVGHHVVCGDGPDARHDLPLQAARSERSGGLGLVVHGLRRHAPRRPRHGPGLGRRLRLRGR